MDNYTCFSESENQEKAPEDHARSLVQNYLSMADYVSHMMELNNSSRDHAYDFDAIESCLDQMRAHLDALRETY